MQLRARVHAYVCMCVAVCECVSECMCMCVYACEFVWMCMYHYAYVLDTRQAAYRHPAARRSILCTKIANNFFSKT